MSVRRGVELRQAPQQFSVLTDTIMHATKIPVRKWARQQSGEDEQERSASTPP